MVIPAIGGNETTERGRIFSLFTTITNAWKLHYLPLNPIKASSSGELCHVYYRSLWSYHISGSFPEILDNEIAIRGSAEYLNA